MELNRTTRQHPDIGSVATRMLWIPAVASILVISFVALRAPQDDRAAAMALTTAHAAAPVERTAPTLETAPQRPEAASAQSDETVAAHETLDPVGAGHDVAR